MQIRIVKVKQRFDILWPFYPQDSYGLVLSNPRQNETHWMELQDGAWQMPHERAASHGFKRKSIDNSHEPFDLAAVP